MTSRPLLITLAALVAGEAGGAALAATPVTAAGAPGADVRKIAVVVGAKLAPPGRAPLRYAHEDARRVSDVLITVGGFSAPDVTVLLDPAPAALLAALDRELALAGQRPGDTFLFFYYSGHADDRAIFPAGRALPFADLKRRLDDGRVKLRMGLLDSCRGGGWTGSKGLTKVEPFDVETAPQLAEEGSVLISSSSGQENAHETETLDGSFFTHHWNAGLRGAADKSGDGVITLGEAFEYARALTIRDTALIARAPQHPSFQMKLSGRQDFPLVTVANQRTTLLFDQTSGPVEFVRLAEGLVVLETAPGARRLRLGLPAGSYVVRRRDADGAVRARVVALSAGGVTTLAESELARSTFSSGRTKDAGADVEAEWASWAGQRAFVSFAIGVRHAPVIDPGLRLATDDGRAAFILRASVRLSERLWLAGPLALVLDAGRPGALTWFAWAGAPVLGGTGGGGDGVAVTIKGATGAGFDLRWRQAETRALNFTVSELGAFQWTDESATRHAPTTWTTQLTAGISQALAPSVSINLGAGVGTDLLVDGRLAAGGAGSDDRSTVVAFGSVQRTGLRPLPLIHVALAGGWGIDAHAVAAYLLPAKGWVETYMAGVSFAR